MKHTMLTSDTLTRFENCLNIKTLTDEAIKDVEHFAYCANMGAESKEAAWSWFKHLVADRLQILLPDFENTDPHYYTPCDRITAALKARTDRSAWDKGVTAYALDLVDELRAAIKHNNRYPENTSECKTWMLNGAQDWNQYSYGGSALVYDSDIAERLCTPSELKKNHNGERRPNSREEWLDTQARALFQACNRVTRLYKEIA